MMDIPLAEYLSYHDPLLIAEIIRSYVRYFLLIEIWETEKTLDSTFVIPSLVIITMKNSFIKFLKLSSVKSKIF